MLLHIMHTGCKRSLQRAVCSMLLVGLAGCRTRPLDQIAPGPSDLGPPDLIAPVPDLSLHADLSVQRDMRICGDLASVLGPPTEGTIACFGFPCSLGGEVPGEVCCLAEPGPGGSCQIGGCPPGPFSEFDCDGPEDCAGRGGSCCLEPQNGFEHARCGSPCANQTLCHTSSDCPGGMFCAPRSSLPKGAGVCIAAC